MEQPKPAHPIYPSVDIPDGIIKRWSYPYGLFSFALQQLPHVSDPKVRARLGWEVDRYWLDRRSSNSLMTLQGLTTMLKALSGLYPDVNTKGDVLLGKCQPSLIETMEETLKRLKFLQEYVSELPSSVLSCVSGGSMSYGRFYNVRGGEAPSDLDLILVYEPSKIGDLTAQTLLPAKLGYKEEDTRMFQERLRVFKELVSQGKAQVFSQSVDLPARGFSVAMHIMGRDVFNNSMVYDPVSDVRSKKDVDSRVLDYKPKPFKYQEITQRDFHGNPYVFNPNETTLGVGVTGQEVISRIPSHAIVNGNYVPGIYQNLVSPRFEFEPLTSKMISAAVTMYWAFMMDLANTVRITDPKASILKSHIRYPIFSCELVNYYEKQKGP